MTQASPTRLEKRRGKKRPNQNLSFDQLVGDATVARLKPYIQQLVGQASQMMVQQVFQAMMSERSMMQTRQLAFESLLKKHCPWFSDDVLAMEVAEVEDKAEGAEVVEDGAQVGDKVRLEFQAKYLDQGEWSQVNKLAIHSLNTKGPQGQVQTGSEALEAGLVGMKAGETREFLLPEIPEEGKEPENTRIRVTVKRVSRRPEPQAPVEAAAPTGEVPANVQG
jgi:hypothetical protein